MFPIGRIKQALRENKWLYLAGSIAVIVLVGIRSYYGGSFLTACLVISLGGLAVGFLLIAYIRN